jgi:septal ring factor EnvC (AmiA/AmiB activator)
MTVARDELQADLKRQSEAHAHHQAEAGQLRASLEEVKARLEKIEADLVLATRSVAERDHTISEQGAQIVRSSGGAA